MSPTRCSACGPCCDRLRLQLQLYSTNTTDTAIGTTPLDTLPIAYPAGGSVTFTSRVQALIASEATLLFDHLTDATGRVGRLPRLLTGAPIDDLDVLD